jgi:membrane protein
MSLRISLELLRRSFAAWNDDDAPRLGACLAFYTILSLSPLILLLVAAASLAFGRSSAEAHLLSEVQVVTGKEGRDAIEGILASGHHKSSGLIASAIGIIILLVGASGVFRELRSAMNTIWDCKAQSDNGIWGNIKERFFSFGMVIGIGFVLLVSLLASASLDAATKYFNGVLPIPSAAVDSINFLISLTAIAVMFALIFKYVPETRIEWTDVRLGALLTALFFTIGKSLLALYLGKASPGSAYGAAGSLVVVVIWVYYSAQIFFFGAEFTHVHALWERGELLLMAGPASNEHLPIQSSED